MINNPPPLVAKSITFTRERDAVSGNVSYTGVGFTPTAIVFLASIANTGSVGMSDGTNHKSLSPAVGLSSSFCIRSCEGGPIGQDALVASMDADGFTLTWTKQGAPAAGTISVIAVCVA